MYFTDLWSFSTATHVYGKAILNMAHSGVSPARACSTFLASALPGLVLYFLPCHALALPSLYKHLHTL